MYPSRSAPRPVIRSCFFAILGGFLLQTIVRATFGEPFPAIVMPPFEGNGGGTTAGAEIRKFDAVFFFDDGGSATFSHGQILKGVDVGHDQVIAKTLLRPVADTGESAASRDECDRIDGIYRVFPGLGKGARCRMRLENQKALGRWFGDRARALAPGRKPLRVELRWHRDFLPLGMREPTTKIPEGVFALAIADETP